MTLHPDLGFERPDSLRKQLLAKRKKRIFPSPPRLHLQGPSRCVCGFMEPHSHKVMLDGLGRAYEPYPQGWTCQRCSRVSEPNTGPLPAAPGALSLSAQRVMWSKGTVCQECASLEAGL